MQEAFIQTFLSDLSDFPGPPQSSQSASAAAEADQNAAMIVDTLWPLVQQGTLAIPRGGYLLRRGRGRIIVEPARS